MTKEIEMLKIKADVARMLYRCGQITREEAKKQIQPYAEAFNLKSKEIAQKYGQRPQTFSLISYLR